MALVNVKPPVKFQDYRSFRAVMYQFETHEEPIFTTGSHAFGNATPDSDFDFFMSDKEGAASFLTQLGFEPIGTPLNYERDTQMSMVYEMVTSDKKTIQVQLVRDAKVKKAIQEKIMQGETLELYMRMNKEERSMLWNLAYDMHHAGKVWAWRQDRNSDKMSAAEAGI